MAELLDILDAFTISLKTGWVVWFAWGIGQIFWYRHERKSPSASTRTSALVRKPFVSKPSLPGRVGTRLITPEPVIRQEPLPVDPVPFAPPHIEPAPAPAPALLEAPDQIQELDRFVADFEMNTRHRRGGPLNGEPSPSTGTPGTPHSSDRDHTL
jgi:hypothetical protein